MLMSDSPGRASRSTCDKITRFHAWTCALAGFTWCATQCIGQELQRLNYPDCLSSSLNALFVHLKVCLPPVVTECPCHWGLTLGNALRLPEKKLSTCPNVPCQQNCVMWGNCPEAFSGRVLDRQSNGFFSCEVFRDFCRCLCEEEAENDVANIVKSVSEILQRAIVLNFTQSTFKFRKSYWWLWQAAP